MIPNINTFIVFNIIITVFELMYALFFPNSQLIIYDTLILFINFIIQFYLFGYLVYFNVYYIINKWELTV